MSIRLLLLAGVGGADLLAPWKALSPSAREHLIIFTSGALIVVPVLVWALFFRKSRRRHHAHHHHHPHSRDPAEDAVGAGGDEAATQPGKPRRWRRPRRPHRPRNPTLAETGGLPPVRPAGPPEPRA